MISTATRVGITAYGGYVPLLRMQRSAIAEAHRWYDPSPGSAASGESALCNWDEDPVTMAVEAGFDCLSMAGERVPSRLVLASTSLPFTDRLNAALVVEALDLPPETRAMDCTSSQRAATSALMTALELAASDAGNEQALVIATEQPPARPMSDDELRKGDAAGAVMLGTRDVVAEYLGGESRTIDFVDHYRGRRSIYDYRWEERWVRDEGFLKLVPSTVAAACARAGVASEAIDAFIINCPFAGFVPALARQLGLRGETVSTRLSSTIGACGVAMPFVGLADWLHQASPGQLALVVGFGQGCDALLFRTTHQVTQSRPRAGIPGFLARRRAEASYNKLLVFTGQLPFERGVRAEYDRKTALSVAFRHREFLTRFTGAVCGRCGTAQLPRARYCIECGKSDALTPATFADRTGRLLSWSADFLAFSYNPPSHYGLVAFDGGGRLGMDISDVVAGEVFAGLTVRPAFRVKHLDERRDFRSYFWKAVPVAQTRELVGADVASVTMQEQAAT